MSAEETWVTLERFIDPVSAQVARSRLEAEGIDCFLADEGMGGMLTYALLRGVRLQVHPEDVGLARDILAAQDDPGCSSLPPEE